jgi:hypothetical protein
MIKRLLIAVVALAFAVPAMAAMNLQQKPDGTADWHGAFGVPDNCAGGHMLHFQLQTNSLSTDFGVSPITNAIIRNAWATYPTTLAGQARFTFWIDGQTTTPVRYLNTTANQASRLEIWMRPGAWGTVKPISTFAQAGANALHLGTNANVLGQNMAIAASSDGGSTTSATAKVILQICPR